MGMLLVLMIDVKIFQKARIIVNEGGTTEIAALSYVPIGWVRRFVALIILSCS